MMDLSKDLFSQQFHFSINGRRRGKKTIVGKIATIVIALGGLGYLMFLMINYFENNFLPKITETTKINTRINEFKFDRSPFSLRFMFQGPAPPNFVLERYLGISVQVGIALTNELKQIKLGKCSEFYPKYASEYTDDDLCLPSGIEFSYEYSEQLKMFLEKGVYLTIFECMGPPGYCATKAELDDFMQNYQFYMWLSFNYDEYDYQNEKLVRQKRQKLIVLERDQAVFSLYYAQKTEIEVDTGYVLKIVNTQEYIHGYEEDNQKLTQGIITRFPQFRQIQTPVLGFFVFPLRLNSRSIKVEYPKITESIAQFLSVINLALVCRYLIRHVSEIKIFEQIMEDMIKFYYQKSLKECQKLDDENEEVEGKKNSKKKIIDTHLFHHNIMWSCKNYIRNKFKLKRGKNCQKNKDQDEKQKKIQKQEEIYENLYDITQNQVEIDQLFKEILQLKTCVQVLLSKEQYAALKFVGRNIPIKNNCNEVLNESILNHLEVQDLIDRNTKICQKYFHDFNQKEQQQQQQQKISCETINDRIQKSLVEQSEQLQIQNEILQNHGQFIHSKICVESSINSAQMLDKIATTNQNSHNTVKISQFNQNNNNTINQSRANLIVYPPQNDTDSDKKKDYSKIAINQSDSEQTMNGASPLKVIGQQQDIDDLDNSQIYSVYNDEQPKQTNECVINTQNNMLTVQVHNNNINQTGGSAVDLNKIEELIDQKSQKSQEK